MSADGSMSKGSVYDDVVATAGMGGRLPALKANPTHIEFELERKRLLENQLLSLNLRKVQRRQNQFKG